MCNPLCSYSLQVESVLHFSCTVLTSNILEKPSLMNYNHSMKNILNQSDNEMVELLLYGSSKFNL